MKSRPIRGMLWKELLHIKDKKRFVTQGKPDIWVVRILFQNEGGGTLIVRSQEFLTEEGAKQHYGFLVI